ncbi:hypothetical protein PLICRDRAFT_45778 [Plicaturopsis crispa FD-325 SS-3]|uniref:Unplaced genomic scaffold PLICRscaffold_16, whole genome shotgun sequence n=1 Tax=Plicaturopsis crispa FD-325 SS-3 TaxID=944288 RepID=A0A0C9SRQ6_PLICR|nr:hypothetical protein PLICRDRAFT_45778 [Plicaturopsis crispa FD-325 SS-3]
MWLPRGTHYLSEGRFRAPLVLPRDPRSRQRPGSMQLAVWSRAPNTYDHLAIGSRRFLSIILGADFIVDQSLAISLLLWTAR